MFLFSQSQSPKIKAKSDFKMLGLLIDPCYFNKINEDGIGRVMGTIIFLNVLVMSGQNSSKDSYGG